MNEQKNHHYVPQVYLRYFAKERKNKKDDYYLYVFDKIQNKVFPQNVKDIGCKINYNRVHNGKYLPPVPDNNELHYENKFRKLIENDWNSIIHKFTATCTLSQQKKILSDDMKFMLAKLTHLTTTATMRGNSPKQRSCFIKRRGTLVLMSQIIMLLKNSIKHQLPLPSQLELFLFCLAKRLTQKFY